MFEIFKRFRKNNEKEAIEPEPVTPCLTPKEIATADGKPWIDIIRMDVDPASMSIGEIELDWNSVFIDRLRDAGFQGKDEEDLVEQWLRQFCRGILMELWEQEEANERPSRYTKQKDIGDGRTEVS